YEGPPLTVGGELDKLASNIAIGRVIAGVHWRSDGVEGMKLGEAVALSVLRDGRACLNEDFAGMSLTKFDGTTVTI
ncbi:MAG: phosphoesterase, partial [Chloroflexota bacterium]|nr:phosphoesterase [Chloroflexota bacterium]